jgi:tRNA pseudouridine55 synthase
MTKRAKEPDLHGILVVDKPPYMTSHDVVGRVRRFTGIRRVGHAGTLDPFATGVVVVAVGRATRILQFVQDAEKHYLAHISLGAESDSADVDGSVIRRANMRDQPDRKAVEDVLRQFIGDTEQIPPAYSAIKVDGQPLYRQARAGKEVSAPPRRVQIFSIELVAYDPPDIVIRVHCGKGTYIRSLARDIGVQLGTAAYCHGLRRTSAGPFCLDQAWTLDGLAEIDAWEHWHDIAVHPDWAIAHMPAVILSKEEQTAWYHGQSFTVPGNWQGDERLVRVYGSSGDFVGVGREFSDGRLRSTFVFNTRSEDEQS